MQIKTGGEISFPPPAAPDVRADFPFVLFRVDLFEFQRRVAAFQYQVAVFERNGFDVAEVFEIIGSGAAIMVEPMAENLILSPFNS